MKNNGNRIIVFVILLIVGLTLIAYGTYESFREGYFGKKETVPTDNNSSNTVVTFSGVYQNGNNIVKMYEKADKTVYFDISSETGYSISSFAKRSGNSASDSMFDENYSFELNGGNIVLSTNNGEIFSGTYNKVSDYTITNYYNDNYGDITYINTSYNGEYSFGDIKGYIYQKDAEKVRVRLSKNFSFHDLEYDIQEDGSLHCELFDDVYEIVFNDNGFVFTTVKSEEEKVYDGTYTKVKTLTIEDIVNNIN